MIALTLAQLAHVLDGRLELDTGDTGDTPDTVVSGGVDTDSRLIEPGGIFVAKPGDVTDGHLTNGRCGRRDSKAGMQQELELPHVSIRRHVGAGRHRA